MSDIDIFFRKGVERISQEFHDAAYSPQTIERRQAEIAEWRRLNPTAPLTQEIIDDVRDDGLHVFCQKFGVPCGCEIE